MKAISNKKSIIDDTEIIELRILELLESDARWWTTEEIASLLGLSKATIQKYLNNLKNRIAAFSNDEVNIETSTSKGILFQRQLSFNVHILYTQILKELLIYSIFNSFLYDEHISIVKVSTENYVSLASVRRKYQTINASFNGLDLSIKKDTFSGDEKQVRWFFSEFYWQIFKGTEWPFRLIPKEFMEDVFEKIQNFFQIELIPEVKEEMLYWITVNSLRHIKGYAVPEDPEIKKYVLNNPLFSPFIEVLKQIFPNEAKNNNPDGPGEMQYLFILLSALPALEKNENYSHLIYEAHKKGQTIMYKMTQEWIHIYEKIFGPIETEEEYYQIENKLLRIHSFCYLYKMGDGILSRENYVNEIIKYHPNFFERISQIYDNLSGKYTQIAENKIYIIENYILLAMEHSSVSQFEKSVRLSLNLSKGVVYEAVVQDELLSYFYGKYKLTFVKNSELKDVLITDLPDMIENIDCTIVSTQLKLTVRDFHNIEEAILGYI